MSPVPSCDCFLPLSKTSCRDHRSQFGQSLTVSHFVGKRFAVSSEIWHFTQPFVRSNILGNVWVVNHSTKESCVRWRLQSRADEYVNAVGIICRESANVSHNVSTKTRTNT